MIWTQQVQKTKTRDAQRDVVGNLQKQIPVSKLKLDPELSCSVEHYSSTLIRCLFLLRNMQAVTERLDREVTEFILL